MKDYSKEELMKMLDDNKQKYEEIKARGMKLDLSRGKPSPDVLDLSNGLLSALSTYKTENGTDVRNYGVLDGIPEAKKMFSDLLNIPEDKIIVGGNSSLNHMANAISFIYLFGTQGETPWGKLDKVKILCPCPGYDRHFALTADFGAEMIIVPMTENGPDMDMVEELVANDPAVKGIWCVPLYSNPEGVCYSDETVQRLASMNTAAPDFRIFWDNAYCIHHIFDEHHSADVIKLAEDAGNPNRPMCFFSTSKITFPGGGIAIIASSDDNIKEFISHMKLQTIGYNKINQLKHVEHFEGSAQKIKDHMKEVAKLIRPKFDVVLETLDREFSENGFVEWVKPLGGYFVSINVAEGCAKKVVAMAKEAGATLSTAGSTYPHGIDPKDSNIRIAPTYPDLEELKATMELLVVCVNIVTAEKLLQSM